LDPGVRVQSRSPICFGPESPSQRPKEESDLLWTGESESKEESDLLWTGESESKEESDLLWTGESDRVRSGKAFSYTRFIRPGFVCAFPLFF
jgi:hypothetical protein